jgi:hypothetical protein
MMSAANSPDAPAPHSKNPIAIVVQSDTGLDSLSNALPEKHQRASNGKGTHRKIRASLNWRPVAVATSILIHILPLANPTTRFSSRIRIFASTEMNLQRAAKCLISLPYGRSL